MSVSSSKSTQTTIGSRLRRFLRFRGMSIREFAETTGIPYRTLQNYLADKRKPGSEHLSSMGSAGVDLNWLLNAERSNIPSSTLMTEGIESPLIKSDTELLKELWQRAFLATDAMQEEYVRQHGKPLQTEELLKKFTKNWTILARTASAMEESIQSLREVGVSTEVVADVISSALVSQADAATDRADDDAHG